MMLIHILEWLLEISAKLGPLAIAAAVFAASRNQNLWTNGALVRAANVEDRKMRLALLDRRIKVLDHLRYARDNLLPPNIEAFNATLNAMREAELVFEEIEQIKIRDCIHNIVKFQTRYGRHHDDLADKDLSAWVQDYQACSQGIGVVYERLRQAAQVREIAPLELPSPAKRKVWTRFKL